MAMKTQDMTPSVLKKSVPAKPARKAASEQPRTRASAKPPFDPGRRASILQAALGVFVQKGFQRSTIKDIAKAADLAEGTIYNHFDNKAALLIGLIEQLQSQRREVADLPGADIGNEAMADLPMDLEQFLPQHLALMLGERGGVEAGVMGVLLSEMLTDAPMREAYAAPLFEPVFASGTAAIELWTQQKLLRKTRPELTSRLIGALLLGVQIQSLLGDKTIHKHWKELPDAMTQLLLHGIKKH
jgi:AcrR family transcriptional regulator